jgi:hypothetical protein
MTFKELRKQKNEIQNKLNMANKTVCLQIDEIQILNQTINYLNNRNEILEKMFELEEKAKKRAKLKLVAVSIARDKNYKNFIDEVSKRNKLESYCRASLFSFSVVVLIITVLLIKG